MAELQNVIISKKYESQGKRLSWRNFLLNVGNGVTNILEVPDEMLCQGDLIQDMFGDVSNQNQMIVLVNRELFTSKNS